MSKIKSLKSALVLNDRNIITQYEANQQCVNKKCLFVYTDRYKKLGYIHIISTSQDSFDFISKEKKSLHKQGIHSIILGRYI